MLRMHLMPQTCTTTRTWALVVAAAFLMIAASRANAQADTTAKTTATATLPTTDAVRRSGALLVFAGLQRGIEPGPTLELAMLVGVAPTIALGDIWELSPEVSVWNTEAYGQKKWYLKVTLPLRWYLIDKQPVALYAVAGPGIIFSVPWVTLDIGGGFCGTLSRSVAFIGELRTYLHDPSGGTNPSGFVGSPVSFSLGVRWTPAK